jgi:hypothetical protein
MTRRRFGWLIAIYLSACDGGPPDPTQPDQCLRREIFMQCLGTVPKGPDSTKYNDWDEVVSECENAAYYQSKRQRSRIKEECRQ